jgi:hypothetical protein
LIDPVENKLYITESQGVNDKPKKVFVDEVNPKTWFTKIYFRDLVPTTVFKDVQGNGNFQSFNALKIRTFEVDVSKMDLCNLCGRKPENCIRLTWKNHGVYVRHFCADVTSGPMAINANPEDIYVPKAVTYLPKLDKVVTCDEAVTEYLKGNLYVSPNVLYAQKPLGLGFDKKEFRI